MNLAEKILRAKKDLDDVYEAGKKEESDDFWEQFQKDQVNYGSMNYIWAFAYARFTDKTYNPKYPIICSESGNSGQNLFYGSSITDTKVPIYANSLNLGGAFYWWKKGVTINKLVVKESTTYKLTFTDCIALKNITIEGVIGQDLDIHYSPLTKESVINIITHLSDTATGKTLSLSKTAVESGFGEDEWEELVNLKSNWTISLV